VNDLLSASVHAAVAVVIGLLMSIPF